MGTLKKKERKKNLGKVTQQGRLEENANISCLIGHTLAKGRMFRLLEETEHSEHLKFSRVGEPQEPKAGS